MTVWNRSYLEAIGLPVWVSRQVDDSVSSVSDGSTEEAVKVRPQAQAQPQPETRMDYVHVSGNPQSKVYLLVTADQDLQKLQDNFKALEQAWKQWQGSDLPLALVTLVEQSDATTGSESVQSLEGKRVLLSTNQSFELASLSVEQAPDLNWQSPKEKKGWWQLLQSLA